MKKNVFSIKKLSLFLISQICLLLVFSLFASHASATENDTEPGVSDSIVRLYLSVFDRAPDADGFEYWLDLYENSTSLKQIADEFVISEEWDTRYGDLDDREYLEVLYRNVLDRVPDTGGETYWLNEMSQGLDRSELLMYFSESEEFVFKTGTATPVAPTVRVPENSGSGRRIIYAIEDQRVWLIDENESVDDTYLVSGKKETPLVGSYEVFSKSPLAWAGHDGITMNHMVRFAWGRTLAIGFHAIPTYSNGAPMQTEDQLGTYRSAGCVRQSEAKAAALYQWAGVGTKVHVLK